MRYMGKNPPNGFMAKVRQMALYQINQYCGLSCIALLLFVLSSPALFILWEGGAVGQFYWNTVSVYLRGEGVLQWSTIYLWVGGWVGGQLRIIQYGDWCTGNINNSPIEIIDSIEILNSQNHHV
jgi:hypothetical protein